jgi:hypothetical protein
MMMAIYFHAETGNLPALAAYNNRMSFDAQNLRQITTTVHRYFVSVDTSFSILTFSPSALLSFSPLSIKASFRLVPPFGHILGREA